MLYQEFFEQVNKVLQYVQNTQRAAIEEAASVISKSWINDGILYVFGCGHSHLIGEDLFYRAGGTACISAMLDEDLMLHSGAVKSSQYERLSGLAKPIFDRYQVTKRDVLLVASTSGINSVPVEMAFAAREAGVPVIAIVSGAYENDESRHPSKKRLRDLADIVIDNGVCHGDASVIISGTEMRVGAISSISGCMIAQSVVVEADALCQEAGCTPPVYVSGNIPGGSEKNRSIIERYTQRIKHL